MPPEVPESFINWSVAPAELDVLWAEGWRHFGPQFFRYSTHELFGEVQHITPLRIALEACTPGKSQRRVLRRNADVEVRVQRAVIDDTRRALFAIHRERFTENIPDALEDFLGPAPHLGPCLTLELGGFLRGELVAASFLDIGETAVSSVYAIFHPEEERRSLGTATMLWEIELARRLGRRWHYPGYATVEPSAYDYKKRFRGVEAFDWREWRAAVG